MTNRLRPLAAEWIYIYIYILTLADPRIPEKSECQGVTWSFTISQTILTPTRGGPISAEFGGSRGVDLETK